MVDQNYQLGGALAPAASLNIQNDIAASQGGSIRVIGPLGAVGYGTGAGGSVTQATNKSTGVTLNAPCGKITMNAASLANATAVGFTFTNSVIAATDTVVVSIGAGGTVNSYTCTVDTVAAGSCHVSLYNFTGGSLAEAVVINFAVIKAVIL